MIHTIVFDFGNVIGHFSHRLASERLAAHAALPADELHRRLFGGPLEDDYESGRLTTEAFLRQVRRTCGLRCPDEVVRTAYADIFWPNPEVCALVPRLRPRYRLFLLSNTNDLHAQHFRRQFADIFQHFDALVLSHEVGHRKPKPEVFEHCRQLAGCEPAECLFIDDLPANVAAARASGWHGIVYRDPADLRRRMEALDIVIDG
jgi:putative hydrolase of the HAD superfamily